MSLITWSEVLSVGDNEIDIQHQKLISIINQLNDARLSGRSRDVMANTLTALAQYVVYHFNYEESLFESLDYDDIEMHKAEHYSFVSRISNVKEEFNSSNADITEDLMVFLRKWLLTHIMVIDKKLGLAILDKY